MHGFVPPHPAEAVVHHSVSSSTLADFLHPEHSFLTSSTVGSRCILYLARGCQRSYWACKFLPVIGSMQQMLQG